MMSQLYNDTKQTTTLTVTDRGQLARGSFSKTQVQTNRAIQTDRGADRWTVADGASRAGL